MSSEINRLHKRVQSFDKEIRRAEILVDLALRILEEARAERERALKRIETLILEDAVSYPTFINVN